MSPNTNAQRGTYIKGLIWPRLEPKTESRFLPISSYWFIRGITQVLKSGIKNFYHCYRNKKGRQSRLKREKLPFWTFKALGDQFLKN